MQHHFVRIGPLGDWVVCRAAGGLAYSRGNRVICRTPRGVEVGEVAADCDANAEVTGSILRAMTTEDEWLWKRLRRDRAGWIDRCREWLASRGSAALLLDVDQLFDSGNPVFYFLVPPGPDEAGLIDELAVRFERHARTKHFAKRLADGCGPGCGTRDCGEPTGVNAVAGSSGGCSGGCAACVVARAGKPAVPSVRAGES